MVPPSKLQKWFLIYLLECEECYVQYVGKAKTDFNLRLNNHFNDAYKADAISASPHLYRGASFNKLEEICNSTLIRETKKKLLK